jgi:hypothetical protein
MEYNRYSVQVLGTVDAVDPVELHQAIKAALVGITKFKVKMIGLDEWVDGLGETRHFDEEGKEILPEPEIAPVPEEEQIEVEEVTI